jgi:hypothetical protein
LKTENLDMLREQASAVRIKLNEAQEKLNSSIAAKTAKEKSLVQAETRMEQTERSLAEVFAEFSKLNGGV